LAFAASPAEPWNPNPLVNLKAAHLRADLLDPADDFVARMSGSFGSGNSPSRRGDRCGRPRKRRRGRVIDPGAATVAVFPG
jgi:hypothetical protein